MAKHLFVKRGPETRQFTSKRLGRSPTPIFRPDAATHEAWLKRQLDAAWQAAGGATATNAVAIQRPQGVFLDFISPPGHEIAIQRLESSQVGISVRSVHYIGDGDQRRSRVTVYVTDAQRLQFLKKLHSYGTEVTPQTTRSPGGKPKNAELMANIQEIAVAMVPSFWSTHEQHLIPGNDPCWCECWLLCSEDGGIGPGSVSADFLALTQELGIAVDANKKLHFPERLVFLIHASGPQIAALIQRCDAIAEFRPAGMAADLWTGMDTSQQQEWVSEAVGRLDPVPGNSPALCVLDSGVNNRHPLLAPLLADADRHAVDPAWGLNDHIGNGGHGTGMAGLAAYGRLEWLMSGAQRITPTHRLESVKIIPPTGANREELYGYVTGQAVFRVEVQAPTQRRSFCMAVAATRTRDRGRPTSWSGAVDELAVGRFEGGDGSNRRLFILAGGNVDPDEHAHYPDTNATDAIHDPGQSWNALTIGGFTELTDVSSPDLVGHRPLAPVGGLAPWSTTALEWERNTWPIKPDVVFEAGNRARGPSGEVVTHDALRLLTTSSTPTIGKPLAAFDGTSAAAALASNLTARIQAAYPNAWPETVRALVVHSADWTPGMRQQLLRQGEDETSLLPYVGWGVPSVDKAIACGGNRLTLIAQTELQPYGFKRYNASGIGSGRCVTKDMHLHELPWPTDALRDLGAQDIRIRVTLSYFIEPSPGQKGWRNRYRYQSHGLRFEMRRPGEPIDDFKKRINKATEDEYEDDESSSAPSLVRPRTSGANWVLGPIARNRGSIHSDVWIGSAAQAVDCNVIAVHPVIGWWRERPHLARVESRAKYALIVSIETDAQGVDIYTPVETQITTPIIISR